jgi:2-amino-4-hydroxy-6-hydroxymethyldihydropteridine diphosphokinase
MPQAWSSRTLISLGANLGDAQRTIESAAQSMIHCFGRESISFSRLYKTAAVGGPAGQEDFFNAVAIIHSNNTAFEIWQFLHQTEQALGRHRLKRWEARRIDLDVLLHESRIDSQSQLVPEVVWTPTFKVPHPRMTMRTFVLTPACDVAPDWIEPVTNQSLQDLSARLDRIALESRLPTVLLSCDSLDTMEALIRSLQRSVSSLSVARFSEPTVFRDGQPWIVGCVVPKLTPSNTHARLWPDEAANALAAAYEAIRDCIVSRIRQSEKNHPSIQFDHWMHVCQSPDSSISHWEDFCRPWADALRMTGQHEVTSGSRQESKIGLSDAKLFKMPPYLLAADDIDWAAHELIAATEAMSCPIQPCGVIS